MSKQLHEMIEKLSEKEAKLLLFSLLRTWKDGREASKGPAATIGELETMLDGMLRVVKSKSKDPETIHLVCGEAAGGSLRVGLARGNKVIPYPDCFAVGPIRQLHQEEGRRHRQEWLKEHLNDEWDYYASEYEGKINEFFSELQRLPETVPLFVWTGENADEQTGMRYLLYLLRDRKNTIRLINSSRLCRKMYNTSEYERSYSHTGECAPEELNQIFTTKVSEPLTLSERERYATEWLLLAVQEEVARVWRNGRVTAVPENHFDSLLLEAVERQGGGFVKAARAIGEVFGETEDIVGDEFLEYRLKSLVSEGYLEVKGDLKAMRYYSVKTRSSND